VTHGVAERFWARVERLGPDDCWEWVGSRNNCGRGQLSIEGKVYTAPRVAWELHTGTAPGSLWVLHTCDNPACCNPAHLFLGTAKDNTQDMMRKGRARFYQWGGEPTCAKLKAWQSPYVRTLREAGVPVTDIARAYGVKRGAIYRLTTGRSWQD
jgi:hypothetical protein